LTSKVSNLIAIVLVAVVVSAGAAYWFLTPKVPNEPMTTVQYTSLLTSSERSETSAESTVLVSATTVGSATTVWLNVCATQPVSYYLSLLESNGTAPYVQLAKELQKLPDVTNATAVAKITYLALNATNPEVKEAFQLMIKGGTPDPRDFTYPVPKYNTQLQVLYWLALQNEFKADDTLALAIAMVNGLWVTMGNEQVKEAVKKETSDLLVFFRETNELQKARALFQLESYPLEAKFALAWTGNDVSTHGWYGLSHQAPVNYRSVRLPFKGYSWDTVSVNTLRAMRQLMEERGWVDKDVDVTVKRIGDFFWNNLWWVGDFFQPTSWPYGWEFQGSLDLKVRVDGEEWPARNLNNADFEFEYFLQHGKGIGVCEDSMVLRDAFLKSWGVATLPFSVYFPGSGDTQPLHYDPSMRTWKLYDRRLMDPMPNYDLVRFRRYDLYIFRPPVVQPGYFGEIEGNQAAEVDPIRRGEVNRSFYPIFNISPERLREILLGGVPTSQMKQWLLYS
jgi:hypothetical protein